MPHLNLKNAFKRASELDSSDDWQHLSQSSSCPRILFWFLVCFVLGKFILTSQNETLAFYLPHDDLWQIIAARRLYWGGVYAPIKLYHLPVFPLFIYLVKLFGLPLRIGLEMVYCGAASLLTIVLWRIGTPVVVAIIAGGVLIFQPGSFQLPNRCGAEVLLTPLAMAALAYSVLWLTNDRQKSSLKYAFYSSICWALAWNVRKEAIVLLPIFILLFLFGVLGGRKSDWVRTAVGVGMMLFACLAMETTIKLANWTRWGLYATSIQTAPGFKSAIKSLQRIRPESPLDYIPVPVEVRQRAYTVSPAFAELRPYLDGDIGLAWTVHSKPFTDSKGLTNLDAREIAAGWFYWAFYDAVVAAGYGSNPAEADRFLSKIAEEIDAAISDGRLPGRWAPVAMIDPAWSKWLPRLPQSLIRIARTFINPSVPKHRFDSFGEEAWGKKFDKYTSRRSYQVMLQSEEADILGWASADNGEIVAIEVRSDLGTIMGKSSLNILRPDVNEERPAGFHITFTLPISNKNEHLNLAIVLSDGRTGLHPLSLIRTSKVIHLPIEGTMVHFAVDLMYIPTMPTLWKIQKHIESAYLTVQALLLWPFALASLAVMVTAAYHGRPVDKLIALLAIAVITRTTFFAIIDASAWPGNQPRYLYAVYPMFSLCMLLVIARSFSIINFWKKEKNDRLINR